MAEIKIPAFGERAYIETRENQNSRVFLISDAEQTAFDSYGEYLVKQGFEKKEAYRNGEHCFSAYQQGTTGVFLNSFGKLRELMIVVEENCRYFSHTDIPLAVSVPPQITQVTLEDFGMSYVIRLSDGRFIVMDGGREFEPDQDRLFQCLKKGAFGERPVIAAWIMTHPHSDHFHCFIGFMDRYGEQVTVERFLFNFPEADDLVHYPKLAYRDPRFEDSSAQSNIPLMLERMRRTGAPIYTAHTGQIYRIGDAVCQILAGMDDTIHCSQNVNASSLVIRMELGGQVILWAADASFGIARLPEKYGDYLKADILQIPHHGFQSGDAEAEIRGYELIRPSVCFLPVSDYNAFTVFCTYKKGTRHLMTRMDIDELITGSEQRTITLPYTARYSAKKELEQSYRAGLDNSGARTWVYSELSTACGEDFCFTLLNMTNLPTTVWVELFFEDRGKAIRFIKAEIPAGSLKRLCIIGEDVDDDALYFNWLSLKRQGIPENESFAVRFISEIPLVVSHAHHRPSYRSSLN